MRYRTYGLYTGFRPNPLAAPISLAYVLFAKL